MNTLDWWLVALGVWVGGSLTLGLLWIVLVFLGGWLVKWWALRAVYRKVRQNQRDNADVLRLIRAQADARRREEASRRGAFEARRL